MLRGIRWMLLLRLGGFVVLLMSCAARRPRPVVPEQDITVTLLGGATMEMVWIPAGTFTMGSPSSEPGRDSDEGPQHNVTISRGFYLGKHEITQAQWESVMGTRPWAGKSYVQENQTTPPCISRGTMCGRSSRS